MLGCDSRWSLALAHSMGALGHALQRQIGF